MSAPLSDKLVKILTPSQAGVAGPVQFKSKLQE